jgi:hypothetical protein
MVGLGELVSSCNGVALSYAAHEPTRGGQRTATHAHPSIGHL